MKYVTAIYYPDGFGTGNTPSNRFAKRVFRWKILDKGVPDAIKRLEKSQDILGGDMVVFVDPRLEKDAKTKEIYHQIKGSKLNIRHPYDLLPQKGLWLKKWHIAQQVLAHIGDFIWMDFMDTAHQEHIISLLKMLKQLVQT